MSVRYDIITAIVAKLADITQANGYNTDCGENVQLAVYRHDDADLPMVAVWPRPEEVERTKYGANSCAFDFDIELLSLFGSDSPVEVSENMLADVITCLTGDTDRWTLDFGTGSTEIEVDDVITGASSSATGTVTAVSVTSGTWAGGDAAGELIVSGVTGEFLSGENIEVNAAAVAKTTGTAEKVMPADLIGADDIIYTRGGTDRFPESGEFAVGVQATFNVKYKTVTGDPYTQA
jgi:hypothetical protein